MKRILSIIIVVMVFAVTTCYAAEAPSPKTSSGAAVKSEEIKPGVAKKEVVKKAPAVKKVKKTKTNKKEVKK